MSLNAALLKQAMYDSIYDKLKSEFTDKFNEHTSNEQKEQVDSNWKDIADAVSEAAADVIDHFLNNAVIECTIPSATYIEVVSGGSGAPAVGTPNTAPVKIQGVILS